jgi:predicted ester cyclase
VKSGIEGGKTLMVIAENTKIIESYYSSFNKGGDVPFEKYFAADFIDHNGYPGQIPGADGVRQGYGIWIKAFPDNHVELADMIAEGDKIVVRTIATGTHLGQFQGISPTNKKVRIEAISIFRLSDGKIAERWGLTESLKL